MYINDSKQYVLDENDAIRALLSGSELKSITTEDMSWVEKFNSYCDLFELDNKIEHSEPAQDKNDYFIKCVNNWHIPDKYIDIDIEQHILSLCDHEEEVSRVLEELKLYKEKNLYTLLKFLVYFVDTLRANNVLWGVGRGSSVSSYILYLIGIHRIDSIKYDLDIGEFLK